MGKSGRDSRRVWISTGLAAWVFVLYGRLAGNAFINFDDDRYVTGNRMVRQGLTWAGTVWAFTSFEESNWHPLTWLSHMTDAQLFGLDPGPHHLVSVAFHAANAVLLFLCFAGMTQAVWTSAFAAALFAAHPLRVESVAWAAERKDVLSGFFFLLALSAYARYAREPNPRRYALVFALLVLGLMSKPMLVTAPFVLLVIDVWPLDRWRGFRSVTEKIPLLAVSLVFCVTTVAAQRLGGSMMTVDRIPPGARLANAFAGYADYLGASVWPAGLAVFYPHPALIPGGGSPVVRATVSAVFLVAAGAAALRWLRARPFVAVGWFWYLGMLIPVIGLVQVGMQARADRYAYLPLIGIHLLVAWTLKSLAERHPRMRRPLVSAAAAAIVALSAVTWTQAGQWRDSITLYRHALAVTRDNFVIHNNLGSALEALGRTREASAEYAQALAIKPDYAVAHYNTGVLRQHTGDTAGARRDYEAAIAAHPDYRDARNNLAGLLSAEGDVAGAIAQYEAVLRAHPDYEPARYNLGLQRLKRGDLAGASAEFERAIELEPRHVEAINNLGGALLERGKAAEAAARFEQALRIRPGDYDATFNLGAALARSGDWSAALVQFQRADGLRPGDETRAAIAEARRALVRRP